MTLPLGQHPKKLAFIQAVHDCRTLSTAFAKVSISSQSHWRWMQEDEEYAHLFRMARAARAESVAEVIEKHALGKDGEKMDPNLLWKWFCYLEPEARGINVRHQHEHKHEHGHKHKHEHEIKTTEQLRDRIGDILKRRRAQASSAGTRN